MPTTSNSYKYIDPADIINTCTQTESDGSQLVFACPMCDKKASFSLRERVGRCFVCQGIIKLHTKYDSVPVHELFRDLTTRFPLVSGAKDEERSRVKIVAQPLSQTSMQYITSRGIDLQVVERFGFLQETTYHDGLYLAWQTYAGDYELRATFPTRFDKVTPKGHQKHVTLAKLVPAPTTCVVCEGLFSAMAYAQLFQQYDCWYVILNSVSNWNKLVEALSTLTMGGIREFLLALDNDHAGLNATVELSKALTEAGLRHEVRLPEHDGDDWNDMLQRQPVSVTVSPCEEHIEEPPHSLAVADYEQWLTDHKKVVVAAPCGLGKTYTAAAYMATHWREGVLYVAERNTQLVSMQQLLRTMDVPPELIGIYYSGSADLKALRLEGQMKPLALITHARMQAYPPQDFMHLYKDGGLTRRRTMIVDEAVSPLVILKVPKVFVKGLLSEMGLRFEDTGKLGPDEITRSLARIASELHCHARYPLKHVGIEADYIAWTDALPPIDTVTAVRGFAYYSMVYQILSGTYMPGEQEDIRVLVPMAPHLNWIRALDQILVLDATAAMTDYLYTDYTMVQPGAWNYHDITLAYKVLSSLGDLTKTTMKKYKESFLDEVRTALPQIMEIGQYTDPYIVTFQSFEEDIKTLLGTEVHHYGSTRGSNAFLNNDAAILLGSYRPPVAFDKLAHRMFGARYSPYKFAVAHWLQELYRTRIRQGQSIHLTVMGEQQALNILQETLGITLWPSVIGVENPENRERILQKLTSAVERALYDQLLRDRQVDIKAFAKQFTNYNVPKVHRAIRGLCQRHPALAEHLVRDDQTIRLIDKPAPTR